MYFLGRFFYNFFILFWKYFSGSFNSSWWVSFRHCCGFFQIFCQFFFQRLSLQFLKKLLRNLSNSIFQGILHVFFSINTGWRFISFFKSVFFSFFSGSLEDYSDCLLFSQNSLQKISPGSSLGVFLYKLRDSFRSFPTEFFQEFLKKFFKHFYLFITCRVTP